MDKNNFNNFFEENNIIIENKELIETEDQYVQDDLVYEIDVYNSLIKDLPIYKQNSRIYQDKYLKIAQNIVKLKNKAYNTLNNQISYYKVLDKLNKNIFNQNWIIPVVLDKQKFFKQIDSSNSVSGDVLESLDNYINSVNNNALYFEDFNNQIQNELDLNKQLLTDKINYKKYISDYYSLINPFSELEKIKNKDVGYRLNLKNYSELLRYYNINNKNFQDYNSTGSINFYYEEYNEDDNTFIKKIKKTLYPGSKINLVGFLVLGKNKKKLYDIIKGEKLIDRIACIGNIEKIKKNDNAIIVLKNHNLKNGDSILIENSNSVPNIDGSYIKNVKVINNDEFMIPINTSEGKEGDKGIVYSKSILDYNKVIIKESDLNKENLKKKEGKSNLYLFPDKIIDDKKYLDLIKYTVPDIKDLIEMYSDDINKFETIKNFNNFFKDYNFNFNDLVNNDFYNLVKNIEKNYHEQFNIFKKFNLSSFYKSIDISKKVNDSSKNINFKNIIFNNDIIQDKRVEKYYGKYPNINTIYDSISGRFNWVFNSPDYGKLYYSIAEEYILKKDSNKTINKSNIKKIINDLSLENKKLENDINNLPFKKNNEICKNREDSFNPVKIYSSFKKLFNDRFSNSFKVGDYCIIKNDNINENGKIYKWSGNNWIQDILIKSIEDLCLFGDKIDEKELLCLYNNSCKSKKQVRIENKIEKNNNKIEQLKILLEDADDNLENIKNNIKINELNLQYIFLKNIEKDIKRNEKISIENINNFSKKIKKIDDIDNRTYLLNLLIKKNGILINKDIYSITSKKKISCGHYHYLLSISETNDANYANLLINKLMSDYGNKESGNIICNNCGRSLDLIEYDENEGLSKITGQSRVVRDVYQTEEEKLKEKYLKKDNIEEDELLDCNSGFLRVELLNIGFKSDQIAKAKDICNKINLIVGKLGIYINKDKFVEITIDIIQKLSKLPDLNKFKQLEIIELKKKGIDLRKVKVSTLVERYNNLVILTKISLIASRLLIHFQTLIPHKNPITKLSKIPFEGFDGNNGFEYISMVIEELGVLQLKKKIGQTVKKINLPLGKIKDNIKKKYNIFIDDPTIKQLFREKKKYNLKFIENDYKVEEQKYIKKIEKVKELPNDFYDSLIKLKNYKEIIEYKKNLKKRDKYLIFRFLELIEEGFAGKKWDAFNPKEKELDCCFTEISENFNYYDFVENNEIVDILNNAKKIEEYLLFFINCGYVLTRHFEKNKTFNFSLNNIGMNNDIVIRNFFTVYIDSGIFIGKKHEYNIDNLCILTGKTKLEIHQETHTLDEYNKLRKLILKNNSTLFKEKEIEDKKYNIIELRDKSQLYLRNEIDKFSKNICNILKKNKDYQLKLKEEIESLGTYRKKLIDERLVLEQNNNSTSLDIINFENEKYRIRIYNLKNYINLYFRKYISIISNNYNPNDNIKSIESMSDIDSKEIQIAIYNSNEFLTKYLTNRESEIFKELKFDYTFDEISNFESNVDIWTTDYKKIKKTMEFNVCHLSELLLYILVINLNKFISQSKTKNNLIIAEFIIDVINKIINEKKELDISKYDLMKKTNDDIGSEQEIADKESIAVSKALKDFKFKLGKYQKNKDKDEEIEIKKNRFIKKFKDDNEVGPSDNQIIDFINDIEIEGQIEDDVEAEEFLHEKIEDEDEIEKGEGYGAFGENFEDE